MISAKNYAAQAEGGIKRWSKTLNGYPYSDIDANICIMTANIINQAVHFAIPDGGSIFDDNLKGLCGVQARLPYPLITVEYFVDEKDALYYEETPIHVPRRVVLAQELDHDSIYKFSQSINLGMPDDYLSIFPDDKFIHIIVANELYGQWVLCLMSWIIPITWDYRPADPAKIRLIEPLRKDKGKSPSLRYTGIPCPLLPGLFSDFVKQVGQTEAIRSSVHDISGEINALLELCEALTCSNVTTETLQHENKKANQKRVNRGKLPIYETKQLVIETPKIIHARGIGHGIDRSSPRQHLRRGHIRKLNNDQRIWVNSCVVGSANIGKIHKTYSVVTNH